MENKDFEMPKTRIELVRDVISGAKDSIEREFSRTANSWFSCAGSVVFQLECYISSPKAKIECGDEAHDKIMARLELLKQRLTELKGQYPEKDPVPPEEIKEEILSQINILDQTAG
jgi:hypothetical protein